MSPTLRDQLGTGALDWKLAGVCAQVDPDRWFPEKGDSTREAKRLCGTCPVIAQCRAYAFEHDERYGIWGGLSERERREIRVGRKPRPDAEPAPTESLAVAA